MELRVNRVSRKYWALTGPLAEGKRRPGHLKVYVVILVLCLRTSREHPNWATWPAPGPSVPAQFMLCTALILPSPGCQSPKEPSRRGVLFPNSGRPLVLDLPNRLHEVSKAIVGLLWKWDCLYPRSGEWGIWMELKWSWNLCVSLLEITSG